MKTQGLGRCDRKRYGWFGYGIYATDDRASSIIACILLLLLAYCYAVADLPPLPHKPLEWIGSALEELRTFPDSVRRSVGYALRFAQAGVKADNSKPLKGFGGAGVLEVIEDHLGDTYRAVYTVRFAGTVYVLHCFQKKSKHGIATPKKTIDMIYRRLQVAEAIEDRRRSR